MTDSRRSIVEMMLTLLPGLIFTSGALLAWLLPESARGPSPWFWIALLVLQAIAGIVVWIRQRRAPIWVLPPASLLAGAVLLIGLQKLGSEGGSWLTAALAAVLLLVVGGFGIAVWRRRLPAVVLWLLGASLGLGIARGATFVGAYGIVDSLRALIGWTVPTLFLTLTVLLGVPVARHQGRAAVIVLLAVAPFAIEWFLDPTYGIAGSPVGWLRAAAALMLTGLIALLLVAAPLWILLARSPEGQKWGALAPLIAAAVALIAIPQYGSWIFGNIGPEMGLGTAAFDWGRELADAWVLGQIVLTALLALRLYDHIGPTPHPEPAAEPVAPEPGSELPGTLRMFTPAQP